MVRLPSASSPTAAALPSYTDLFGVVREAEGLESRSALSPAAYLVDLLLLQDHLSSGLNNDYHARRPDVQTIRLDEVSTYTEVPQLEIANAVMAKWVPPQALGQSLFPAPLPFAIDHARLDLDLRQLGTTLEEVYRAYPAATAGSEAGLEELVRQRLAWTQAEFDLYSVAHTSEASLKQLWGTEDLEALKKGTVALLEAKLDVSLKELKQILTQDLAEYELMTSAPRSQFFVNEGQTFLELQPGSEVLQVSGGAAPAQLGLGHLDRLMRFVRLARRLQLEFSELDWLLQTVAHRVLDPTGLQALAIAVDLKAKLQLPVDELCSLWALPKQFGAGDGPVPQDLFDRIFNNGFSGDRLEKLVETSGDTFSERLQDRLQAALRLSATEYSLLFAALVARSGRAQPPAPSLEYCAALYRYVALARALGIGIDELIALTDVVDAHWARAEHESLTVPLPFAMPGALPARPLTSALLAPATPPLGTLTALQRLLVVKEWADARGLSAAQLSFLCLEDDPLALVHVDDGAPIEGVLGPDTVESTLADLLDILQSQRLQPVALQTGSLSPQGAQVVFDALCAGGSLFATSTGALIQVLPTDAELDAAFALGVAERLEVYASDLAALGVVEADLLLEIASQRGYLAIDAAGGYSIAAAARGFFALSDAQRLASFVLPNLAEQAPSIFALLGRAHAGAALDWRDFTNGPLIAEGGRATFSVLVRRGYLEPLAGTGGAPPAHRVSAAGKAFFQQAGNAVGFTLPGLSALQNQVMFDVLSQHVDDVQLDLTDFVFARIGAADVFALFSLLARRGYAEQAPVPAGKGQDPVYQLSAAGEVYFRAAENRASFTLPNFDAAREAIFALLSSKVQAYARAAVPETVAAEKAEILERITSLFERQYRSWQRLLAGLLGVSEDLADLLFVSVFATPDQSNVEAFAHLTLPLVALPATGTPLSDPWLAARFRRLRQLALLAAKAGLDAEQLAAWIDNQQLRQRWPETLQLPADFTGSGQGVDAVVRLPSGDRVVVSGQGYVRYSGPRYRPSEPGTLQDGQSGLQLPASFAAAGIDAGFTAADGTVFLFAGEGAGAQQYVSSLDPQHPQAVKAHWGRVHNQIQEQRRVDAGVQDLEGRVILFSADQYVRYGNVAAIRDAAAFVDESYPRSLARAIDGEHLPALPSALHQGLDAAFQEGGVYYFFAGHQFARSDQPGLLQDIAGTWGQVRNEFVSNDRVDAALTYGGVQYLFCGDQYTRYSTQDYTWVDEGYPRRFHGNWNALEKIGNLPDDFALAPDTLSAVVTGIGATPDVYFFSGHEFVGPRVGGGLLRAEVKSAWSRVRNNIERLNRVDAALLDAAGRLYLFSADQFFRYTQADNHYTDESYPRRSLPNWGAEGTGYALPEAFKDVISATVRSADNRLYFFSGTNYARVDAPAPQPVPVRQDWGLVYNWIQSQNAVNAGFSDASGATYLFGGDQFVRYGSADLSVVDDGFPRLIGQRWGALPPPFPQGIDAAFVFPVRGTNRLYLIKDGSYVRYSTSDYTKPDPGFPKPLRRRPGEDDDEIVCVLADPDSDIEHRAPFGWQDNVVSKIQATYVDTYKGKPRLVLIYLRAGVQWRRDYRQEPGRDCDWTGSKKLSEFSEYSPFKTLDTAFVGRDGTFYAFSGGQYAFRRPTDTTLSTPVVINSVWAKVWNEFAELSRVDATLDAGNGRTYLFCDRQYIRYTGTLRPGAPNFFVDDGYPRKIAGNWEGERVPIVLPPALPAEGVALVRDTTGKIHFFNGPNYTNSDSPTTPRVVNTLWGLVENQFQDLNRVDAAYRAENDRLYLFCNGQYTRYTGALTPGQAEFYSDEGYPKRIPPNWPSEGLAIALPDQFSARGNAILRDAQQTYVFAGWAHWNSKNQPGKTAPGDIVDTWARVRNELLQQDRVDAACLLGPAGARRLYLFSADQFVRYSLSDRSVVDEGYPLRVKGAFAKELGNTPLPVSFDDGVDAALSIADRTFLFANGQYVAADAPADAKAIESHWGLVENRVQLDGKIDTAFVAPGGQLYLFRGDQYFLYSHGDQPFVDEEYPKKIAGHLGAEWPAAFRSDLGVAFTFEGSSYLFKGSEQVRISDLRLAQPDAGYPKTIASKFSKRPDFELGSLPDYWDFKQLADDFSSPPLSYLEYLAQAPSRPEAELPGLLSQATGWPALAPNDQIRFLLQALSIPVAGLADTTQVARLARRFRLADRLGSTPSKLQSQVWQPLAQHLDLTGAAEFAYGLIKARTSTRDWPQVAAELRDPILALQRDALVGYLLSLLNPEALAPRLGTELGNLIDELAKDWVPGDSGRLTTITQLKSKVIEKLPPGLVLTPEAQGALVAFLAAHGGLEDANALYELLLTDVQMAGSSTTSQVVEALGSIQLYYHRALVHLEDLPDEPPNKAPNGPTLRGDLKRWWPWMKHFRVWEANRKVFLHPENYIRPELRRDKSPEFKELEQNLLQDDITTEAAEAAYRTYLDKFNEVSRLRIAGGYTYQRTADDTETHVVLLGHTRTSPPVYYYRLGTVSRLDNVLRWDWWKKVGVTINAERVQPVWAFNKLFLFWLETKPYNSTQFQTSSNKSYGPEDPPARMVKVSVNYSFLTVKDGWVTPQTLRANPNDLVDPDHLRDLWSATQAQQLQLSVRNPAQPPGTAAPSDPDSPEYIFVHVRYPQTIYRRFPVGVFVNVPVGRLNSGLDLELLAERHSIVGRDLSSVGRDFTTNTGITPNELIPWGSHLKTQPSFPWFSFESKGGTFLCRPQEEHVPDTIKGKAFSDVSAAFQAGNGDIFVFQGGSTPSFWHYVASADAWSDGGPLNAAKSPWGRRRTLLQQTGKSVESVIVGNDGRTHFNLPGPQHFTYPRATRYDVVEQRYARELIAGLPSLTELLGSAPALAQVQGELVGAFLYDGDAYLLLQGATTVAYFKYTLSALQTDSGAASLGALNAVFVAGDGSTVVFTSQLDYVALDCRAKAWSSGTLHSLPPGTPSLTTAFKGADGKLYFICGQQYAAIDPMRFATDTPTYRAVDSAWGRLPSVFTLPNAGGSKVDGALLIAGTAYLFSGAYCSTLSSFDPALPDSLHVDQDDDPQRITDLFQSDLEGVADCLEVATVAYQQNGLSYVLGHRAADPADSCLLVYSGAKEPSGKQRLLPDTQNSRRSSGEWDPATTDFYASLFDAPAVTYSIVRLTTHTAEDFIQRLFVGGLPLFLSRDTQQRPEQPEFSTTDEGPHLIRVNPGAVTEYPGQDQTPGLDFESTNYPYYWEIFFHIPYRIAQALDQQQRYEDAKAWYEYVFDPTEKGDSQHERPYWRFKPFSEANEDPLETINDYSLTKYRDDPFDPHAIAELRQIAYRKAFVMSYIDTLVNWGDQLFRRYTREDLGEASMLYVLAAHLLGRKPDETGKRLLPVDQDGAPIRTLDYSGVLDLGHWPSTVDLHELENEVITGFTSDPPPQIIDGTPNDSVLSPYFYVPENQQFVDYWQRIALRLERIRNGMDIDGIKRSLALFEPPLDVMALVQAFASGAGAAQALSDFSAPVPHYRFAYMLGKARELTGHLMQLGGALLSALEKKDAEALTLLRNTQERAILELTQRIKEQQLENATESVEALKVGRRNAENRRDHYQQLLSNGLSDAEKAEITLTVVSTVCQQTRSLLSIASGVANLVPDVGSPFAMKYGGTQVGGSIEKFSFSLNALAELASFGAQLSRMLGGWERRAQDWQLQLTLATGDVDQVGHQLKGAEAQLEVARQELKVFFEQLDQNQQQEKFYRTKFTNQELYQWMTGKLSAVYFQTYQLALDYAKGAQRALQFELGLPESDVVYVNSYQWDSLKKGLLAGEQLQLDLDRLERAHMDRNRRRFEITKNVSLLQLDPVALWQLKEKGKCEFSLGANLFEFDFPGHYCRQLKTVSLSLPAVVGPYDNVNATLTQLSHSTLLQPSKSALDYLLNGEGSTPDAATLRADWRPNQQVALSRGVNDSGLFQLNYQDERYLPFEGTGAISRWRLEINGVQGSAQRQSLTDVIVTLQYTAISGGEAFADTVKKKLKPKDRGQLFNVAYDFSSAWSVFLSDPKRGIAFSLDRKQLPGAVDGRVTAAYLQYELTDAGVADGLNRLKLKLTDNSKPAAPNFVDLTPGAFVDLPGAKALRPGANWLLKASNDKQAARFNSGSIRNMALVLVYASKPAL